MPLDVGKHSQVLYHFTSIQDALSILQQKQFRLSFAQGTGSEATHQKGYAYFLSTTRSKTGRFTVTESAWQGVVFTLNAAWFARKYKIVPVDYWGRGFDGNREAEDRVLSNKGVIPIDLNQAIESIHVLVKKDRGNDYPLGGIVRKLLILAKQNKVPIYIYGDQKSFLLQDPRKALPIKDLIKNFLLEKSPKASTSNREKWAQQDLYPYIELLHKKESKHLSPQAKKAYYNLHYPDATASLQAKLHNGKKSEAIRKLSQAMRDHKISTPEQLVDHLREKWNKIKTAEHKIEMKHWWENKKRKKIESAIERMKERKKESPGQ